MKEHNDMKDMFDQAYDRYADAVFRFALIKVSDRDTAKDITQDTFVKVWSFLEKGGRISSWRPFLFKTARNIIVDHYRKKKSDSLDTLQDAGFDPEDTKSRTDALAESREVISAMRRTKESYRDVLWMRFVEGLSPEEIAETLDVSENVVSVRIHRGKEQLKKLLNNNE